VKRNTKIDTILDRYAECIGERGGSLRLFFDGERIDGRDYTVGSCSLADCDMIDAQKEALGD